MSSGLANAQQQPQTSIPALSFPGLSSNFSTGLSAQTPQSVMDMQQLMLASLDPNFASNPLRAYYLSQLAALSTSTAAQSSDQSLPSSSSAASSSTTGSSGATTTGTLAASSSPQSDLTSQNSQTAEAQAALNAISLASLGGGNTSDPSPTPGTTTSQVGESSVPSAASTDLPNWLSSFFPGMNGSASASNVLQASANSLTAATSGIPNLFEQMQLLNAAQMMSSGLSAAATGNSLSGPPLNALAAALNQQPSVSVTTAPPLTPNGNAALFSSNTNYNSPSKESYCDLCDKTFCNRYFLKTHRQKKHGIVGESQSPVKSFPSSPSAISNIPLSQAVSSISTATSTSNSLSTIPFSANLNALMAAAAASSASVPATSSSATQSASVIVNGSGGGEPSSPPEKIPKIDSQENDCVKEKTDESNEDGERLASKQQDTREPETSVTEEFACNLCSRSFSSLFALVSHKTHDHPPLGSNAAANQGTSQPQSSPIKASSPSPTSDEKVACELCDKEFESRQYLQQHILLQHCNVAGNAASLSNSLLLSSLPLPFMLPSPLPQNFQVPDVNQSNLLNAPGINGQFNQPKQAVKRQYSSTEKNYCDLCNKNLCNKYFLRTHMFKMHKIVIDENKTVIANVDTLEEEKSGAVSFRCDVCGVDVKTRHELRSHKQEAHGVIPIQTPPTGQNRTPKHSTSSTPSLASVNNHAATNGLFLDKLNAVENKTGEQCLWCEYKAKDMNQLQEHIQEKHTCQLPPEVVENFRRLDTHQSLTERMNMLVAGHQPEPVAACRRSCNFCSETFTDELLLQTHTISKHTAEMCLQNNPTIADEKSVSEAGDNDNTELLKCTQPQCNFRSLNIESLQLHLERHTPLDSALLKMRDQASAALAFLQQKNAAEMGVKIGDVDEDEDDEAMEATTAVALQMAKANEEKPFPCPVASCQRRYHDSSALEKHIAKVHQWHYKMSPKKPSNGIIARSKLAKLTKRYSCQFPKCQMRFSTRQLCREHVLTHFKHEMSSVDEEQSTDNPQTSASDEGMDSYVREEDENLVKDIQEHLADSEFQKEHEQHSHTSGSMSPTSENMPEGFARSIEASDGQKPYLMQSFIMRKYCAEDGQPELLQEVLLHLPVRAPVDRRLKTTIELIPASEADAPLKRI